MKAYFDTAPIIYLVESSPLFGEAAIRWIETPGIVIATFWLRRMECLVKPLRLGDWGIVSDFGDFFFNPEVFIIELSRSVLDRAARLRAVYGFKTPDAIHLAEAVHGKCEAFVTNDHRLARCAEIKIEVIGQ